MVTAVLHFVLLLTRANALILPVSAPTSNIDRSIPLWRQAGSVRYTVVKSERLLAFVERLNSDCMLGGVGRVTGNGGPYLIRR